MKIANKLILGYLLVGLLAGAVGYSGIQAIKGINSAFEAISQETLPVTGALDELRFAGMQMSETAHRLQHQLQLSSAGKQGANVTAGDTESLNRSKIQYEDAFRRYEGLINNFFPEEKGELESIRISGQRLGNASTELIEPGKREVSGPEIPGKEEDFEKARSNFLNATGDAIAAEEKEFAERKVAAESALETAVLTILSVVFLSFITATALGITISNSISNPIIKLKDASENIGKGRLDTRVDVKPGDEMGILTDAFNLMADNLEQNMAERESAEAVVEQLRHRNELILNSAGEGIFGVDSHGSFTFINQAALDMTGYEEKELIGKSSHELIHHTKPDGTPLRREECPIYAAYKDGVTHRVIDDAFWRKDGTAIPVEYTSTPIREAGLLMGAVAVFRDTTERKNAEKVRRENERLALATRAKAEFLTTMSHELRTPLNSIIGFSELIRQKMPGELNEKQEHYVNNVITSANNLLRLINDILDISNVEADKIQLEIGNISVPEVVEESLMLIKEKAAKHNIVIKKELDPWLVSIESDKQRLKQVLFNLLSNAVKFSKPEGGTITITTKREGDVAKFAVSDTGIGIREEDMGRLFYEFEQLDSGISRNYGGTGLGLAISKKLVELQGGSIWAESRPGEGSTFTFTLPLTAKGQGERERS